jgi:hypothetical protein
VILPGGDSSHAMLYQIQLERNGTYTFRILNTGQGLQYHHQNEKGKYQAAIWRDLTLEQISNKHFLFCLLGMAKKEDSISLIYDTCNIFLGAMSPPHSNSALYHKPQNQGTCTQQVIQFLLHNELSETAYLQLKLDLTDECLNMLKDSSDIVDLAMVFNILKIRDKRLQKLMALVSNK